MIQLLLMKVVYNKVFKNDNKFTYTHQERNYS